MKLKTQTTCPKCDGKGQLEIVNPEALRALREKAGRSLRSVAQELDLSAPFVSDMELGRRGVNDFVLKFYKTLKKERAK